MSAALFHSCAILTQVLDAKTMLVRREFGMLPREGLVVEVDIQPRATADPVDNMEDAAHTPNT